MPRRLPSSALDSQTQLTASSTGAVLAGTWYIGTGGAGSGGAVAGTLNGPLTGTADYAKQLSPGKALNGTTFTGGADITVPTNTTSIATSGTYYPTFVPSNTAGNQQASTHASLNYDPNTGYLSATRFVGSGAGLSGVVNSISFNGGAAFSGAVSITSPAQVQPDWNATTGLGQILNKPALFSGSYTDLSSKPTLFDGNYNSLTNKPTIPTAVSNLTQDTVLYGTAGYGFGMGAVPGYTWTSTGPDGGGVDTIIETWNVPATGVWSFSNITLKLLAQRLNCNGWLSTTQYSIASLEINITGVGWRPIATAAWNGIAALNSVTADGQSRKVGIQSSYFIEQLGYGRHEAQGNDYRKPYYISAGANIRYRQVWATTLPVLNLALNDTGVVDSTDVFNPIVVPGSGNYEWRAYPVPISASGSWYLGNRVEWSAIRVA